MSFHPGTPDSLQGTPLGQLSRPRSGTWDLPAALLLFLEQRSESQRIVTSRVLSQTQVWVPTVA